MFKTFYLICQTYVFFVKTMWKKVLQKQTQDLQPNEGRLKEYASYNTFKPHSSFETQQMLNEPPILTLKNCNLITQCNCVSHMTLKISSDRFCITH